MSIGEASIGINLGTAQLDVDVRNAERILNRIGRGVIENSKQAEKAIEQLSGAGVTSVDRLQRSFNTLNIKTGFDIEAEKRKITAAFEQIKNSGVASASEIRRAHDSMKSKLDGLDAPIRSATNSFGGLGTAAMAFAAGFSIQSAIFQLHAAGMAAERLRNSFEAATGSAAKGSSEFGFARAEANRLGLDLLTTSDAYLKLAASARGTTLEGQKTRDIFTALAGAGRSLGLSGDQMGGALLAISQMMSKGTVQAEELRGQLGERLPGAFNIAARAMGVSTAELGKLLEGGKVISEEFLPKFAAELTKTFPPGEKAMNGMTAETMRLKTAWYELKTTVMEGGGESMFTASIRGMKDMVKEADTFYGRMSSSWRLLKDFAKNPMNPNLGGSPDVAKLPPLTAFDNALTGVPATGVGVSALIDRGRIGKLTPIMTMDAEARNAQEEEMKAAKKAHTKALTDAQKGYQAQIKEFLKTAWDGAALELAADDFSGNVTKKLGLLTPKPAGFTKTASMSLGVDIQLQSLATQDAEAKRIAEAEKKRVEDARSAATELRNIHEAEIQNKLLEIDMQEKLSKISGSEALNRRIPLEQELVAVRKEFLDTMDSEKDKAGWLSANNKYMQEQFKVNLELKKKFDETPKGGFISALRAYADEASNLGAQVQRMTTTMFNNMEDAIVKFAQTGKLSFKSMADSIIADMIRIAARQAITGPLASLAGAGISALTGSLGTSSGSDYTLSTGTKYSSSMPSYSLRAAGGPVTAGESYIVGEKRPELFTPGASGFITPYVPAATGGNQISISIPMSVTGSKQLASDLRAEMESAAERVLRRHA